MWKDIIGFEGIYKLNEYGDVINNLNHILHPYLNNKGYKCIDLSKDGHKQKFTIHRLVAIHFVPNPNNYPIVLHKDNIKTNTHYTNLEWGTYSENNSQAIRDGLNKLPRPDNRKHYKIYNEENSKFCFGTESVLSEIGFGNNSYIRNILHRDQEISQGIYEGYKVMQVELKKPIYFYN